MNYISIEHLESVEACGPQATKFKEVFGDRISFGSLDEAKALSKAHAHEFDFDWAGEVFFGEAYLDAKEPLWTAYLEAKAPIWKAYSEGVDTSLHTYMEARAPLGKAYKEALAQLFAEMWWSKD